MSQPTFADQLLQQIVDINRTYKALQDMEESRLETETEYSLRIVNQRIEDEDRYGITRNGGASST